MSPFHMVIPGGAGMPTSSPPSPSLPASAPSPNEVVQHLRHVSIPNSCSLFAPSQPSQLSQSSNSTDDPPPTLSFDAFATELRLHRLQEDRLEILRQQQRTLQRAAALSARLSRTVNQVQQGLVETLKNGDKAGFANAYHTALDLKDGCSSIWNRNVRSIDSTNEDRTSAASVQEPDSLTFMHKLPAGSRADVLDFVHLLRTNSSFLVDRIQRLNPSQLSALASSPNKTHIPKETLSSTMGRGTNQASQQKRNAAFAHSLRDTAWSLERTTAISALLFNSYSAIPDPGSDDWRLRLDTWSSTCANLYSHSDQTYHYLLLEVLNSFASLHEWRAKPRLEPFLMNLLQTGAFLLEPVEDDSRSGNLAFTRSDPLHTPEAEDFFESAVNELFGVLNDRDGGLPFGALHFASAVLGKLSRPEQQSSFRGFLLHSWYSSEFLFSALRMPETKGMLLHHHVSRSARDSILKEVAIRAQSRVTGFLDPASCPVPVSSAISTHLEQMVSAFISIHVEAPTRSTRHAGPGAASTMQTNTETGCLTLSVSDLLLLIDMLIPQPTLSSTPWDSFLSSSATAFAAQYRPGLPPLSKIFPAKQTLDAVQSGITLPSIQSSAAVIGRKFDQIRRDLQGVMERRDLYPLPHPIHDAWAVVDISSEGCPLMVRSTYQKVEETIPATMETAPPSSGFPSAAYRKLDRVQRAALRLVSEHNGLLKTPRFNRGTEEASRVYATLESLLAIELDLAEGNGDSRSARYWWSALSSLRTDYPLSVLTQNDTRILWPALSISRQHDGVIQHETRKLEIGLRYLEDAYERVSGTVSDGLGQLHRLRDKMWYLADITNSNVYEDARNVAEALRNMASPSLVRSPSPPASIRGRRKPRSLAESILQEPEAQTISIMKASLEQGGPKKLADDQVEMTRKWLQSFGVDNFCRGEERIHRFCIEIRRAANRLVGESISEGPILWSSELYSRERPLVDGFLPKPIPASSITRPSSIFSEEGGFLYSLQHPHSLRGFDGGSSSSRPSLETQSSPGRKSSFHSLNSDRWRTVREFSSADGWSILDPPSRAVSATTSDSIPSIWSPFPTQPQSTASVSSLPSRPASMINDMVGGRPVEQSAPRKSKFLEELRRRIINLLLSDLGSPVWSCGSETDAWIADVLQQPPVQWQLQKREGIGRLLEPDVTSTPMDAARLSQQFLPSHRSKSCGAFDGEGLQLYSALSGSKEDKTDPASAPRIAGPLEAFPYQTAYEDLMDRFSRQADPICKIDILNDLKSLVISSLHERRENKASFGRHTAPSSCSPTSATAITPQGVSKYISTNRRSSWNPESSSRSATISSEASSVEGKGVAEPFGSAVEPDIDEKEVVKEIKLVLTRTRPKTLFRDLQFITAFVPSDVLNKTAGGKAFLHVGLAALAFKDDVCRGLVSVADQITIHDNVEKKATAAGDKTESALRDAGQMWILAAKEGNAAAQRELATLYLSNPDCLPSVSLPLSMPRDVFRPEMKYWSTDDDANRSSPQAMCLALHWMQLAAGNGDTVATSRLKEREAEKRALFSISLPEFILAKAENRW